MLCRNYPVGDVLTGRKERTPERKDEVIQVAYVENPPKSYSGHDFIISPTRTNPLREELLDVHAIKNSGCQKGWEGPIPLKFTVCVCEAV